MAFKEEIQLAQELQAAVKTLFIVGETIEFQVKNAGQLPKKLDAAPQSVGHSWRDRKQASIGKLEINTPKDNQPTSLRIS